MSTIWVDKYKPKLSSDIIGQSRNVARIKSWLKSFESNKSRPLFIYGPPGIGKTTAAHLCCKETGYQTIEFNASDQRNKNIIKEIISTIAGNSTLSFVKRASETKDAIILDEIDGMAGNEDRGGIAQLIYEIRFTKKPMIFICNDGQHQKLRSLKDKCEIIEFKRPDYDAIRMVVSKIAGREGLKLDKINVRDLADSSDFDIRQIVNSLSLFKDGGSGQIAKTTRLNAFEACKKALTSSTSITVDDRFDCFFADYNIMPLFIHENYAKVKPSSGDALLTIARAANSIALGDLLEKQIRSNQNWSLLNAQALCSTVIPSKIVASNMLGRIDFPQYLGKLSNTNKRMRLTQELNAHMSLSMRGGLDADTLDVMCTRLSGPLMRRDSSGIDSVVDFMSEYSLTREDFNSIMELATWSFKPDPMARVDTKTKTSFTNAYKKRSISLPYFTEDKAMASKKKKVNIFADGGEEIDDDEEEEDDAPAIKPKRVTKTSEKPAKTSAKSDKASAKTDKTEKPEKTEKPSKASEKPAKKTTATKEKATTNGSANGNGTTNGNANGSAKTADKRPADLGIARFFVAKKPKT